MKLRRFLVFTAGLVLALSAAIPFLNHIRADSKRLLQIDFKAAQPRQVEDSTQQSIVRDYTAAWEALRTALANNNTSPLNDNFTGFALERLTQRIKDQQQNGLTTRIIDHGHKAEAVFYSPDGSALELRDTASIETQVRDGNTVIHSDQVQVHYYAVLTGAEDRWKVRVLESAE